MTAIQQYKDLFKAHRELIDENSCAVLNSVRDEAFEALEEVVFPKKGDEDYEVTDEESIFAPDYGINFRRMDLGVNPSEVFRCEVPNMSTSLFFLANDIFKSAANAYNGLPDGVIVKSLKAASDENKDLLTKYYGKVASLDNPQTAVNTLLAQDGLFMYIPKGVVVEKPIQLVNILNSTVPLMVNRRILIVLEEGAQAKLLVCDHTQDREKDYLASQVVEIYAAENSVFDYYDIEDSSPNTNRVSSVYVHQEEGSNVMIDGITLRNGTTRNNYVVDMAGDHAELHLLGMAIVGEECHVDNHTVVNHSAKYGKTNELFKYVLDNKAIGAFSGLIRVEPGAVKTEAYQSNKNICASDTARMYTKPQLLIDCDDVKCSHGSTIGQIDQNALFYMRSRGIPEKEARLMLMQAFMHDVISGVRMESLKDRLRHLVENRFLGNSASCAACQGKSGKND